MGESLSDNSYSPSLLALLPASWKIKYSLLFCFFGVFFLRVTHVMEPTESSTAASQTSGNSLWGKQQQQRPDLHVEKKPADGLSSIADNRTRGADAGMGGFGLARVGGFWGQRFFPVHPRDVGQRGAAAALGPLLRWEF